MKIYTLALLALVLPVFGAGVANAADAAKEEALGLVLSTGGGTIVRANTVAALAAHSGDVLFSGDTLRTTGTAVDFLYCPGASLQTLNAGGEILLEAHQLKVKSGKIQGSKPMNTCFLPQVSRVAAASQQHYGAGVVRGLTTPELKVIPLGSLSPAVQKLLEPLEAALRRNPSDAMALVEEAAIFEQNGVLPNALAAYRRGAELWPDAAWVQSRVTELEDQMAPKPEIKSLQP